MSKKILAILMAVAMAFSLLPATAFAEEGTPVAKIGEREYTSLDAAIIAAKDTNNAVIEVLTNCETTGLNLTKNLTIQGAEGLESKPTITFTDKGIALWGNSLTFKNCDVVMNGIGSTPYSEWSWMTVCASKNASLSLDKATMTMDGKNAGDKHAIYFCSNNKLNLSNNSKLEIKNYKQDALEWDGGDGGYNVNIKDSTYISDHNRSGFTGTFYATIDHSTVKVTNSAGNGSNGTYYTIKNTSDVTFNNNGSWGISAWRIDMTEESKLTATNNGYSGIWTRVLNVDKTCTLDVRANGTKDSSSTTNAGIFFQGNDTFKSEIQNGATVTIQNNVGSGIYTEQSACDLTIGSATIINNGTGDIGASEGGGIYNVGKLVLDKNVVIYNNHAQNAGDDIYSTGTITFGKVGTDWTLDDCGHLITGWFKDGEKTGETEQLGRWSAHQKPVRIDEFTEFINGTAAVTSSADVDLALKAAHGEMAVDPAQSEISKSKTATNLDSNYESKVTLSIPSAETTASADVVIVIDISSSMKDTDIAEAKSAASQLCDRLNEKKNAKIKVGIVTFDKEAHELTNGLVSVEEAKEKVEGITPSSDTNMMAGLIAGKKMLDEGTSSDKYMVIMSDGIPTYWVENGTTISKTLESYANDELTKTEPAGTEPEGSWPWSADKIVPMETLMSRTDWDSDSNIWKQDSNTGESLNPEYKYTNIQKAAYKTARYLEDEIIGKYKVKMVAYGTDKYNTSIVYKYGENFCDWIGQQGGVSYYKIPKVAYGGKVGDLKDAFDSISDEIIYLVDNGSYVTDYMGYVEGDYNFDFINDVSKLSITVGTKENQETLNAEKIAENHYGFRGIEKEKEPEAVQEMTTSEISYRYELEYVPGEKKGDEYFIWRINVPVSNFAPVALTYSVKLVNPKSASGTYGQYDEDGSKNYSGLYTNNSATLYPMDSKGQSGVPENFLKPTVSYTVSGGNSGGNNGGNSKPSLNTKDHYGYIIGYPVDYYTGQPTTDQTKKPVRPEGKITRAEVATIYFRMLTDESRTKFWSQSSGYSDVKTGDWFNNAVSTLSKAGIIAGYEDGSFRPNGYITRAEFATIAARFFDVTYNGKDLFPDISGHWAKDYINQAANKGFVNGYEDGTFKPDRNITRAEAVTLVNRTLDRHPDKNHFTKDMLVWPDNMDQTKWYYADMQEATNSHTYQMKENSDKTKYENWTKTLPIRNWEALEKAWSNANSSQGNGNVV